MNSLEVRLMSEYEGVGYIKVLSSRPHCFVVLLGAVLCLLSVGVYEYNTRFSFITYIGTILLFNIINHI